MMRTVKGLLIDPYASTVKEVEYDGDDYTAIYPLLSNETVEVDCFTAAYPVGKFAEGDCIYVDDEGLLKDPTHFFKVDGYPDPLAGIGLVVGTNDEGETVSAKTKLKDLKVTFFTRLGPVLIDVGSHGFAGT